MSSLADEYCDQLKRNFKTLYATFPPNEPVMLGDYGVMNGNVFVPIGKVSDLGIPIGNVRRIPERASDVDFTSEGSVDVELHAAGSATPGGVAVNAGIDISFSKKFSIFFFAAKCVPAFIEDQVTLGNAVLRLLQEGKWQKKFVVITSLLEAGSTTIVVSASDQSSIALEATSSAVPAIDLGDVTLKLSLKRARSVGLKVVTQGSLTPLIGLSKVSGLFRDGFGPFSVAPAPAAVLEAAPPPQLIPFAE